MDEKLRSLIDMLDSARDEQTVKSALKSFGTKLGYEKFAYLQAQGSEVRTFNTYPESWQSTYLNECFFRIDPVVTDAKRRKEMFAWAADDWTSRRSTQIREFRDRAIEHGIHSGVTIPVEGSFGSTVLLTFASEEKKGRAALDLGSAGAVQAVLAVHYRLEMIEAETELAPGHVLSSREMMCLRWAAKGKSAPETAVLAGINPRTVQHYLDKARQKLDAATVPHLVAIAKDQKLI